MRGGIQFLRSTSLIPRAQQLHGAGDFSWPAQIGNVAIITEVLLGDCTLSFIVISFLVFRSQKSHPDKPKESLK